MKTSTKLALTLAVAGSLAAGVSTIVIADQSDIAEAKATAEQVTQAKFSYQQAAQIAVDKVSPQISGQVVVVSVEFDNDHSERVWEVELVTTDGAEHEIDVSSETGAVLKHEVE